MFRVFSFIENKNTQAGRLQRSWMTAFLERNRESSKQEIPIRIAVHILKEENECTRYT